MKSYLKYLIPPILTPKNFNKAFNTIFYKNKNNHYFEYENSFYKRHAFINLAISKFQNCKYLEIGVENNDVFNSIPLKAENKFGVDPVSGGNFRMTSDKFFQDNSNLKFDVIFIDGLHEYIQCQKDCINSMKHLNPDGIILFHDLLPRSYFEEKTPKKQSPWLGDVWKVAVELSNSKNVDFKIINIDFGIGVLKIKSNHEYNKLPELKNKNFSDYLNLRKQLEIISCEDGLEFILEN